MYNQKSKFSELLSPATESMLQSAGKSPQTEIIEDPVVQSDQISSRL